jgi:two-component system sensor histidine kinase RegB
MLWDRKTPPPIDRSSRRFSVNFSWLIKLRWVAVIGQLLTIAFVVYALHVSVQLVPLAIVLAVTTVSNLVLAIWFGKYRILQSSKLGTEPEADRAYIDVHPKPADELSGRMVLGSVMALDMLSLTTLLYASGGPANPFYLFFFVNLSLSALLVGRTWAWALNALTIACFAFLIYDHVPIPQLEQHLPGWISPGNGPLQRVRETGELSLQQSGALVAFATCTSVIVYFMTLLTSELQQQEDDLRIAQDRQAQSEKLEALGTLAAGAAHELATPLSTIAIVARELEQRIDRTDADQTISEDVRLIRSELDRCRKILDQMSTDAGQATGESLTVVTVQRLVEEILKGLPVLSGLSNQQTVDLHLPADIAARTLRIPLGVLSQTIRGLIKNGIDATLQADSLDVDKSQSETSAKMSAHALSRRVQVSVSHQESLIEFEIQDFGVGMTSDVLRRISDPFFTTKPVGQGMGLGVFLAMSVISRLGGEISFESQPGRGTSARIVLKSTAID